MRNSKNVTSARPPHIGMRAVDDNAYAEPTHTKSFPCKSLIIVGRAVVSPVKSKAGKKSDMQMEPKISQNLAPRLIVGSE